ncbi:MAG TPA: copper chaperone PCu(A)C [Gammaproteobacteria bacterium]|nr:copper chaperone PCu(A)C [Gammaproteobacteria bacterium]
MLTLDRTLPRLFIALGLLLAGSAMAAQPVTASGGWIRLLPGDLPLAGYVTLHNSTDKPMKLVGVKSAAFKRIEMHHSMTMSGMDKMMPVSSVTIPASGEFSFSPGGYHLMMWRRVELHFAQQVPVTLEFADGSEIKTEFTVKGPAQ